MVRPIGIDWEAGDRCVIVTTTGKVIGGENTGTPTSLPHSSLDIGSRGTVASDGYPDSDEEVLVIWDDVGSSYYIHFSQIAPDGTPVRFKTPTEIEQFLEET